METLRCRIVLTVRGSCCNGSRAVFGLAAVASGNDGEVPVKWARSDLVVEGTVAETTALGAPAPLFMFMTCFLSPRLLIRRGVLFFSPRHYF